MKMKKESKVKTNLKSGVTLVTLVITIIVLLILAGITINLTIGEDGIIKRAQQAGKNYVGAAENERWQLGEFTNEMDNIIGGSTNNGRGPYNSEFRNNVIAALKEQGVQTLETDNDETIIGNIGKIFEERTKVDSEVAAMADNLTQGKQAYVNGELITGTGKDAELQAQEQYLQGYMDGQKSNTENIKIEYVYHKHDGNETSGGACYTSYTYEVSGGSHFMVGTDKWHEGHRWMACSYCGQGQYDCNMPTYFNPNADCPARVITKTGYELSCGKTEETIESATIKY